MAIKSLDHNKSYINVLGIVSFFKVCAVPVEFSLDLDVIYGEKQ